jgi:hypothetical protein
MLSTQQLNKYNIIKDGNTPISQSDMEKNPDHTHTIKYSGTHVATENLFGTIIIDVDNVTFDMAYGGLRSYNEKGTPYIPKPMIETKDDPYDYSDDAVKDAYAKVKDPLNPTEDELRHIQMVKLVTTNL